MKKMLLSFALGVLIGMHTYAQITTIALSPATTLTGTTQYTNDYITMSLSEEAACHFCGSVYEVYSLHTTTSILANQSFAFQPGYSYTMQLNGSAVASGDLSGSGPSTIYYGVSLGPEATTTAASTAFPLDPSAGNLYSNYAGGLAFQPPLNLWEGYGTVDLTSNFLSGVTKVASLPNSATSSNSTSTSSFTVGNSVLGFNIEPFPVVGTEPAFQQISEDGGTNNGTINPSTAATTTTLTVNSVIITATPLITPIVNYVCNSQIYSIPGSTGAIWTVTPATAATLVPASGTPSTSVTVTVPHGGGPNFVLTATLPGTSISNSIAISSTPTVSVTSTENGSCENGYQAWQLAATPNAPNSGSWLWTPTLDNGPYEMTTTTAPNTTVSIDGRLELSVTYEDACGIKPPQPGTVVVFSNCNEPEAIHFDASPNPASSMLELLPHHNPGGGVQPLIKEIKIYDLLGRLRSDAYYGGVTQQQVGVGNLENGFYFVLIYMQDGKTERKKVLVHR